jgi:CheY-like chemotaxis protein
MDRRLKRTILVVEDVAEISSQMNAMLRAKGHDVLFAADAKEAFKIAETRRPTLVLTDLDLPTLGLLLRLIREHPHLKKTPVAIMDINEPVIGTELDLKVLANMDELEKLIQSTK